MKAANNTLSVKILDVEYTVACPVGKEAELDAAAKTLDQKMRDIRSHAQVYGQDKVAVMAALNLAYELQSLQREQNQIDQQLDLLSDRIEQALPEG